MEPLYIPHLAARRDRTLDIIVNESIPEFETLTPVRGKIVVKHSGTYLDIWAQTETIVTLTCYRCLQQYNHKLVLDTTEVIWLDPDAAAPYSGPLEKETGVDELIESLPPDGHFEPTAWLYEQLCLVTPQRQLCARTCTDIIAEQYQVAAKPTGTVDNRWGALESLKDRLQQ